MLGRRRQHFKQLRRPIGAQLHVGARLGVAHHACDLISRERRVSKLLCCKSSHSSKNGSTRNPAAQQRLAGRL